MHLLQHTTRRPTLPWLGQRRPAEALLHRLLLQLERLHLQLDGLSRFQQRCLQTSTACRAADTESQRRHNKLPASEGETKTQVHMSAVY